MGAELIQTDLQRCFLFLCRIHKTGDLSELRLHAGSCHHKNAPAAGYQGAGECHIGLIAQGRLCFRLQYARPLLHRQRLSGQRALIHLKIVALQQPSVCRHQTSCIQQHNISRHQLRRWNFPLPSIPQYPGSRCRKFFQAFQRFSGLFVLDRSQNRIHRDDRKDDHRTFPTSGKNGNGCRRDQNQHQKILKLLQKDLPGLLSRILLQCILTILCIPRFCLPRRKPGPAALQPAQGFLRCHPIPCFHFATALPEIFRFPRAHTKSAGNRSYL